jgi:hypothetical protein
MASKPCFYIYVLDDVQRGSVQKWLSDFKNNAFSEEEQSILKGSPTLLEQQRVRYIGAASPTKASSNRIGDYWCLGLGYFVTARGDATQENVKFDTVDHGKRPVIRIDIGVH